MTINCAIQELEKIMKVTYAAEKDGGLNEKQVVLQAEKLLPAVQILLSNDVYHLSAITGVYDEEHLVLLYHFWQGEGLTLRIVVDGKANYVDTLTVIIPGAAFYEREIAEMFGVEIRGLDTSGKMFLPDNWEGEPPMRKYKPEKIENQMEDE